ARLPVFDPCFLEHAEALARDSERGGAGRDLEMTSAIVDADARRRQRCVNGSAHEREVTNSRRRKGGLKVQEHPFDRAPRIAGRMLTAFSLRNAKCLRGTRSVPDGMAGPGTMPGAVR